MTAAAHSLPAGRGHGAESGSAAAAAPARELQPLRSWCTSVQPRIMAFVFGVDTGKPSSTSSHMDMRGTPPRYRLPMGLLRYEAPAADTGTGASGHLHTVSICAQAPTF